MQSSIIPLTAKKSHYGVDGTGRDSYINFDNGGNYRGYGLMGLGKFERGAYDTNRKSIRKHQNLISGRPLHYIGDGTGRDFYVINNDGGIAKGQFANKKFNFLQSLRTPIRRKTVKPTDILMQTQDSWKTKGTSSLHGYQNNLDRRLSVPRQYQDPYVKMRKSFQTSIGFK